MSTCEEKSSDPGAARFGNFINYYEFNPSAKRLCHLPNDLLRNILKLDDDTTNKAPIRCLDIGCNTGDLTIGLQSHFGSDTGPRPLDILGVDLDANLIECAQQKINYSGSSSTPERNVSFLRLDMTDPSCESVLSNFLSSSGASQFDVIFCFSVTMWIHLNHGDAGLAAFFHRIAKFGKTLVLEPQPWKCYRTASRRMRKLNEPEFDKINDLKFKGPDLLNFLDASCLEAGFKRVSHLGETHWSRPIWVYNKSI